ncbi:MAG: replication initiator protein [Microvirus sp.]|nr:MAG: replication initiator protein [Microvirus sp.]
MPCYHPVQGFRAPGGGLSFNPKTGYVDQPLTVPCGQCIGCRLERSRQWAVRCVHEASLHGQNCFITLTYDQAHLPEGETLVKKHLQDFNKRLRQYIHREHRGKKISFFACGEYGDALARPHYHELVFGFNFPDRTVHKKTGKGTFWRSPILEKLWGKGHCLIGSVTFETAAYCARYTVKKVTGDMAEKHYTGKLPEFMCCSTRPAIGLRWIEIYHGETYQDDTVISRGREAKPPRYYDKVLKRNDEALHASITRERKLSAVEPERAQHSTPARLAVRETVAKAKTSLSKRTL